MLNSSTRFAHSFNAEPHYIETVFLKYCVLNHMPVHTDGVIFKGKGHLKIEASNYTTAGALIIVFDI